MFKGLRSQASAWRPLRPGARWFNPIRFESTPSSPSNLSCSFELKVAQVLHVFTAIYSAFLHLMPSFGVPRCFFS